MDKCRVYTRRLNPGYFIDHAAARRRFVTHALDNSRVVLVRPAGLNYEVTMNDPTTNQILKEEFPNFNRVDDYLDQIFNK